MSKEKPTDKKTAEILKYLELIAGTALGAAGPMLVGVHDPHILPVATTVGTAIGAYAGARIGKIPFLWHASSHETRHLVISKLNDDFDDSPLNLTPWLDAALDQALQTLVEAQLLPQDRGDERIPQAEIIAFSTGTWRGGAPQECLDRLMKRNRPIVVNCSCIEVAAVAVLKSIAHRYDLDVNVEYDDPNGHDQIQSVLGRDEVDFLIVANGPVFLSDHRDIAKTYRILIPCHGEMQYLFKRKNSPSAKIRNIAVFPQSSAEEQFRTGQGLPGRAEKDIIPAASMLEYADNLGPRDAILVWEPLATALRNKPGIDFEKVSAYRVWISLFANKRWLHPKNKGLLKDWEETFVSAWIYCQNNRRYAAQLLLQDQRYLQAFKLGSGLSR